jgi:hypothetical protein
MPHCSGNGRDRNARHFGDFANIGHTTFSLLLPLTKYTIISAAFAKQNVTGYTA